MDVVTKRKQFRRLFTVTRFDFLEIGDRFLLSARVRSVVDSGLVVIIESFENLHEAKEVLLRDLVVVLEAVVALKHKLALLNLVSVDELEDVGNILRVFDVGRISEVEELGVGH